MAYLYFRFRFYMWSPWGPILHQTTKFEHNVAMHGWVIAIHRFCLAYFSWDSFTQIVLRAEWSKSCQFWIEHRPFYKFVLDFPFQNEGNSKATEVENWGQISHFYHCKIKVRNVWVAFLCWTWYPTSDIILAEGGRGAPRSEKVRYKRIR